VVAASDRESGSGDLDANRVAAGLKLDPKWCWEQYWLHGRSLSDIAKEVGCSVGGLHNRFQAWGYPTRGRGTSTPKITNAILTAADIVELKERAIRGDSKVAIARHFGISRARVYAILHGHHRRLG